MWTSAAASRWAVPLENRTEQNWICCQRVSVNSLLTSLTQSHTLNQRWIYAGCNLCVCVCVRFQANGRVRTVSSPVMEEETPPTMSTELTPAAHTHRHTKVTDTHIHTHTHTHTRVNSPNHTQVLDCHHGYTEVHSVSVWLQSYYGMFTVITFI